MALPIKLLSFTGDWDYNNAAAEVLLKWATGFETNNSYFEIERSMDLVSFNSIQRVFSKSNTDAGYDYSARDRNPKRASVSGYRLKQVDLDGHYTYSRIILIQPLKNVV